MAQKVRAVLEQRAEQVAVLARVGSDLSRWRFAGEPPRYTHLGFAVREGDAWEVHHLLNTAEGSEGHLYRQPLLHFFRDDPFEYRAAVLVLPPALQHRLAALLRSPEREALHTVRYSRVAYPFATRYQSSTQWVLESIGAAQGGGSTRAEVQRSLAARGFAPDLLISVGLPGQLVARWLLRNTPFDDHPLRNRLRGRIELVLEPSVRRYLRTTDALLAECTVGLGVPPGAPCPARRLPGCADV